MDAKVGDWVVTPRLGKPIEINALWINALWIMADWAERLGEATAPGYRTLAEQAQQSFQRFWHPELGYGYDVLDGPEGDDPTLRPNQILAVSLPGNGILPRLFTPDQERRVVERCGHELLTSHGLRSLSPFDPRYQGVYAGDPGQRDGAYHQGTVWGWLLGAYAQAHYQVFGDQTVALSFLQPYAQHLYAHGVGSLSEIFDGDAPFVPRGCIAQAWTVAEVLRVWAILAPSSPPRPLA
ncbi:MAG: hypothetical protein OHK0012_22190 [Synechococcales cyanobacterium]